MARLSGTGLNRHLFAQGYIPRPTGSGRGTSPRCSRWAGWPLVALLGVGWGAVAGPPRPLLETYP
ncbi:hypothetical protein ACRAWF_40175 [Streptomyces sp. L7]